MERPEHLLNTDTLPSEVPTLGGRGTRVGVGGPITVVSGVAGKLAWISTCGDYGGVVVVGSDDDADMSNAEAGTNI